MMLVQHHVAAEYRNRAIDQFAKISRESLHWARVMALIMHPYNGRAAPPALLPPSLAAHALT
jgi:hypothetical protein